MQWFEDVVMLWSCRAMDALGHTELHLVVLKGVCGPGAQTGIGYIASPVP